MVNNNLNDEIFVIRSSLQQLDIVTKEHSKRIMELSDDFIPYVQLSNKDTEMLSLTAALHDIGKKYISPEILNKNGSLNNDDWEVVRTHPFLGWELIKQYTDLTPVAEAILHHHERWDGKGYPTQCSKEKIPILSRIVAVLDAFDAMTNNRPYRKAMPVIVLWKRLIVMQALNLIPK